MKETDWAKSVATLLRPALAAKDPSLAVEVGARLAYAHEILQYHAESKDEHIQQYETDILIKETTSNASWIPRVVIETKLAKVTTHDAITYSQKAATHKAVHAYLRYGIFLGYRRHFPLPGRLFRHGAHFDFMVSWKAHTATPTEVSSFISLLQEEVQASRDLQQIIFESRKKNRARYTTLHRPLKLSFLHGSTGLD